jgi:hypothetical protein
MINTLLSARKLQSVSTVEEQRLNNDGRLIRLDYVFRKTAPAARSNITQRILSEKLRGFFLKLRGFFLKSRRSIERAGGS